MRRGLKFEPALPAAMPPAPIRRFPDEEGTEI